MTSYDEVLYPARPFVQTHPDRLATLATLFGLEPASPASGRVLELGCGVGGNLLPMAAALPGSTFVGIDDAGVPIARARAMTERLGLDNLRFEEVGIEAFETDEQFDFVIAHGVFSWVPEPVRDALLALCGRVLAPSGVAYVSYNALPGSHLRLMLREVLAHHLGSVTDPQERIAGARAYLARLIAAGAADEELVPTLARAAREVSDRDDAFLFHDVLAEHNRPLHLREFLDRAGRHGLRFLAEAQFSEMQADALPAALREGLPDDLVEREQELDVLKERRFRQTLLCRAERSPTAPRSERLTGMGVSAALRVTEASGRTTFLGPGTARVETEHPLVVRTLRAIAARWPSPVWIADLGDERERPAIHRMLLQCHAANLVRLHMAPPFVSTSVPARPAVSPVARLEAVDGPLVTTVRHTHVELDADTRAVAALLDGSRDADALRAGTKIGRRKLEAALERLAAAGTLLPPS